ncbi:MAG: YDG domain-containing protein, partial [Deltaproteobacteria bacterium]|nr:YDG domain-containing protein [Deltaproteobacteria bacterium]
MNCDRTKGNGAGRLTAPVEKKNGRRGFRSSLAGALVWMTVALGGAFNASALDPNALPTGGQITAGQGSIAQSGSAMTVTQGSDRMVANWNTFNIGQNASVAFRQPGAGSVALNRIWDQSPSQIFGRLTANGQVFLLNPSGIFFGPTARVDVGGLVASSLHITDENFLAGRYLFGPSLLSSGAPGAVFNQGSIRTSGGGYVAFLSPQITNEGTVAAPGGSVAMAAGSRVNLDFIGDRLLTYTVEQGAVDALIQNKGLVQADGGMVLMTAKAASDLANSVVNNSGIVEARGIENRNGRVLLGADLAVNTGSIDVSGPAGGNAAISASYLMNAGTINARGEQGAGGSVLLEADRIVQTERALIDARGRTGGGKISLLAGSGLYDGIFSSALLNASGDRGGEITLAGRNVILRGGALDASGSTAGGSVRVGGDLHGAAWSDPVGGRELANAAVTDISSGSVIDASTAHGDGGGIVAWSDEKTSFYGEAKATGGAGRGGFIEISGKERLRYGGSADASSASGAAGTVLFDPKEIVIDSSAGGSGLSYNAFVNPNPGADTQFGGIIATLSNGNMVVVDPYATIGGLSHAGAAYLFKADGTLVSTITGSHADDMVGQDMNTWNGGPVALSNGNYAVASPAWNGNRGAVTWGGGTTGVSGIVSADNSLVGSNPDDWVGGNNTYWNGIVALTNGNYVVSSPNWANGAATKAGAATWVDGTNGHTLDNVNTISAANSLVGSKTDDQVASKMTALTNGNYVVVSPTWDNGAVDTAGAATWGDGTTGVAGTISAANSLVGTRANDQIGGLGATALTNGNYVVVSEYWHNDANTSVGAATWVNGGNGQTMDSVNTISVANSHLGSSDGDNIGINNSAPVLALTNGNYVILSRYWNNGALNDAGAATWGNGATGSAGLISADNSLVGGSAGSDVAGAGGVALTNGNYVVLSPYWDSPTVVNAGAATWGNGTTGTTGAVSTANSLTGGTTNSLTGSGATPLSGGNYVVNSHYWNNGAGAATWVNGTNGQTSNSSNAISADNSLIGSTSGTHTMGAAPNDFYQDGDHVGQYITALSNGNYVVNSPNWNSAAGAVTWGSGTTGVRGTIDSSNSLVGAATGVYVPASFGYDGGDKVGSGVTALSNGNYVVNSPYWSNGATSKVGAVTWASGTTGMSGSVSAANSLTGSKADDKVGYGGVAALDNGNYVVGSPEWDNGATANAGAATWADGTTGITGALSADNSLIGASAGGKLGGTIVPGSGNVFGVVDGVTYVNGVGIYALGSGSYSGGLNFGDSPDQAAAINPTALTDILNTGSNLVLQANNDITVNSAVAANNAGGNGGNLTLQAGRSILVNADITTDNGNLTLTANETAAAGVVDANRDAGAAAVTMAGGTSLNAGSGAVAVTLKNGAGNTHSDSGDITLRGITAGSLDVANQGPTAGSDILLNGAVSLSGNLALTAASGDISQTGALTVAGTTALAAGTHNITLDHASNDFTGAVSATSGAAVAVTDAHALTLGAVSVTGSVTARALTGDLNVAGAVAKTGGDSDATVTLQAGNTIVVDQAIRKTGGAGKMHVALDADNSNGTRDGDGIIILNGDIQTGGGNLTFGTGAALSLNGVTTPVGGDIYVAGAGARTIETGGGNVAVNGETIIANTNGLTINTGNGHLTFGGLVNSGNTYTGVSYADKTWSQALANAASGSGLNTGDTYLATITSRLENALASRANSYNEGWLGARRLTGIGSDLTWRWVAGPEGAVDGGKGLAFFTQNTRLARIADAQNGTPVGGAFNNWNNGEPNNWNGSVAADNTEVESVMQFTGNLGKWNDLAGGPLTPVAATQNTYVKETNLAASPLTIDAGSGNVTFSGMVGGTKPLASLNVTSTGAIAINGGGVTTTGATSGTQTYNGNITLGKADTVLTMYDTATPFTLQSGKSITNATGMDATLTVKTTAPIILDTNSSIISPGGKLNTVLWADTDGNGGYLSMNNGSSIDTHGGHLWMGGGSGTAVWNGLAVGDGYALGNAENANGVFLDGVTLGTEGGNIAIYGKSRAGAAAGGDVPGAHAEGIRVATLHSSTIDSGTGTILMDGVSQGTSGSSLGIEFSSLDGSTQTVTSAAPSGDAIALVGNAAAATSETGTAGVYVHPDTTISATGGGNIRIVGTGGTTGSYNQAVYFNGGSVDAGSGNLTISGDTLHLEAGARLQGSGALAIRPQTAGTTVGIAGGAGTLNLPASYFSTNIADGFSGITLGSETAGDITLGGTAAFSDNLTLVGGGNIALNDALNAAGQTVTLTGGSGATVSGDGNITAAGLLLNGSNTAYDLNTAAGNSVGALAVDNGSGNIRFLNGTALEIGTVGGVDGIATAGTVDVATKTGDLTLSRNIVTTDASADAVRLNAGRDAAAGTSTGGNIVVSGAPAVTTGAGGRATLLSGGIDGSTGLTALVGSGSGRFRYNSDESDTRYTAALGTGAYAIYREQPLLAITPGSATVTYGEAVPAFTGGHNAAYVNGDGSAGDVTGTATWAVGGAASSTGHYTAGSHDVSYTGGLVSSLGYGFTDNTGSVNEFAVEKKAITATGIAASAKAYDGDASASLDFGSALITGGAANSGDKRYYTGDIVNLDGSGAAGTFADKNAGAGKAVTVTGLSLSGADAGNYTVSDASNATADINPKALTLAATAADKTYDGNANANVTGYGLSGFVGTETVTAGSTSSLFDNKNAGTGKSVTISGITLANGENGGLASNYAVDGTTTATADIDPKALTLAATAASKTYDGNANATVTGYGLSRFVGTETVSAGSTSALFDSKNAGTGKTVTISGIILANGDNGGLAANYSVDGTTTATADINPKALTLAATAANKTYDGNANATVTGYGLSGFVGTETVSAGSTSALFDNKNAGTGKSVT